MKQFLYSLTLPLCMILSVLLNSCAYIPEQVGLDYMPRAISMDSPCQKQGQVYVYTIDNRRCAEVGCKKGDGGIELASIHLTDDLADVINQAVTMEIENLGFGIAQGDVVVNIEVNKFYNDFKPRILSWNSVAELFMNVNVVRPDGMIVYSKTIIGMGENNRVWFASGQNAKLALDSALHDAIHKLIQDQAFLQALVRASRAS